MEPEMSNLCLFHGGVKTSTEVPTINPSTVAVIKDLIRDGAIPGLRPQNLQGHFV